MKDFIKSCLWGAAIPALFLTACSGQAGHHDHGHDHSHSKAPSAINTALLNEAALVKTPEIIDCTLENGAAAQCAQITVKYLPDDLKIGPFCPKTLDDDGGIWPWDGENPGLYRVDRAFLEMVDKQGITFHDPDGSVHIADIAVAEPVHEHACINVSEDEAVEITVLIPTSPVKAESTTRLGTVNKVGLSLKGTPIFSDAPSVFRTGHMPALDVCAGHIDPGGWYHFHGTASDLKNVYKSENVDAACHIDQDPSALFAYAFDGYPIYGHLEADGSNPQGLDACNGHSQDGELYHYHATTDFPNLPSCLSGVSAQGNFSTTAQAGVGANPPEGTVITRGNPPGGGQGQGQDGQRGGEQRGGGQGGLPPGFDEAAEKLGITAEELFSAMEKAGGRNADLAVAAKSLGISEEALKAALPQRPAR